MAVRILLVSVAACALWAIHPLGACDTPVYRYAMYRWDPAPYEVYYFHSEAITDEAAAVHKAIEEASRDEQQPANVILIKVNLTDDPELKRVPRDVREAWRSQPEPAVPSCLVVTPYGLPLHRGDLDQATFDALRDSPARRQIADQLADGKAGVFVLVTSKDEAASQEAEKTVQEFVKDVSAGKIELYLPPAAAYASVAEGGEAPPKPRIEVGFIKVSKEEAKEKWLVESLLSMEQDLKDEEFANQPMMFVVFGRGRGLPPCVGKGINRDNLLDCVDFVTGACSCTVKDQNPGMDLLISMDWNEAAEKVAKKFGFEEGNEYAMAPEDLFPQLMIPSGQPGQTLAASEQPAEVPGAPAESSSTSSAADDGTRPTDPPQGAQPPGPGSAVPGDAPAAGSESASGPSSAAGEPQTPERGDAPAASGGNGQADTSTGSASAESATRPAPVAAPGVVPIAAGVVIALLVLFAATFFMLRPR
jgi:hypothetical protein